MNLSRMQTHRQRTDLWLLNGVGIAEGWIWSLELAVQATVYRMDTQQGPAV